MINVLFYIILVVVPAATAHFLSYYLPLVP